jgi:hypothetical protein
MTPPDVPSTYEEDAARAIVAWRSPPQTTVGTLGRILGAPLDLAADAVMKIPGVGWAIRTTVRGIVKIANDLVQWTVLPEAIFSELERQTGKPIAGFADIARMELREIDEAIEPLAAKYKLLAAVEGVETGWEGPLGIPPDIILLITINLRAIGEYATYYGFDVTLENERLFVLHILGLASCSDDETRATALAELTKVAASLESDKPSNEIAESTFATVVPELAESLTKRLARAKLAQVVPVAGVLSSGPFNTRYTDRVCEAAFHLYRERFLQRRRRDEESPARGAPDRRVTAGR